MPSSTLHALAERFSSRTSHCEPKMSERTVRLGPSVAPPRAAPIAIAARTTAHTDAADNRILSFKGMYLLWLDCLRERAAARGEAFEGRRAPRAESQEIIARLI